MPSSSSEAGSSARGGWGVWNYTALWMTAIHSVPGYVFVVSLIAMGHGVVTDLVGTVLGAVVLAALCCVTGLAGLRTRSTFPDLIERAYGPAAARFASTLRGVVAIGWYGVQTYLATVMVTACLGALFGGAPFGGATVGPAVTSALRLGMTPVQWGVFAVLSVAQAALLISGSGAVRRLAGLAGPVVWVCLVALVAAQGGAAPFAGPGADPGPAGLDVGGALDVAALTVAFLGGPAVNYADFGRLARSRTSLTVGTGVGVLGNVIVFFVVAAMIGVRYPTATGEPFSAIIVGSGPVLGLALTVALGLCTVGANVVMNFVSATFDLCKVTGDRLSHGRAVGVIALAAALSCPGLWYSSSSAVVGFVTVVGVALGPLAGVLVSLLAGLRGGSVLTPRDFWLPLAAGALAEALTWLVTGLLPALGGTDVGSAAWFTGAAVSAVTGLVRVRRTRAGAPAASGAVEAPELAARP